LFLAVAPGESLDESFRHGMAHLALDEAAGGGDLPLWLHEGYAIHFGEQRSWARGRALWWAAIRQDLVSLADLDVRLLGPVDPASVEAAQVADLARLLADDEHFPRLFGELRAEQPFEAALGAADLANEQALEQRWRQELARGTLLLPGLIVGTALWLVAAALVALRRRKGQTSRAVLPFAGAPPEPRESVAEAPFPLPPPQLRTHGVPKISYDGRWHTLH
jgi:hypothetical protein